MAPWLAAVATLAVAASCFAQTDRPEAGAADTSAIAVVLGKEITAAEETGLNRLILGPLLQQFAAENTIEPTEEELDTFLRKTAEKENHHRIRMEADRKRLVEELEDASLSDREREQKVSKLKAIESILQTMREMKDRPKGMVEQMRPMNRRMAQRFVKSWKINKALYDKYGGRVIFQQAGVEPLDAYRAFLREREENGAFKIMDKQYEARFWRYFTDDAMHTFYNKDDGARLINTPWWMMDEPPND